MTTNEKSRRVAATLKKLRMPHGAPPGGGGIGEVSLQRGGEGVAPAVGAFRSHHRLPLLGASERGAPTSQGGGRLPGGGVSVLVVGGGGGGGGLDRRGAQAGAEITGDGVALPA
eukprot:204870-Prorocentrum_minimum.AAC.1